MTSLLPTGVNPYSTGLSVSSRIQKLMEQIIITIKGMDTSSNVEELRRLNRLLYRSMDNLMEFQLELLQLKDSSVSKSTQ